MQPDLTIRTPDDWHVHLRDDEMLGAVARFTAQRFGRALIMPNLDPPITTRVHARDYRHRILDALRPWGFGTFSPLMTLYLTLTLDPGELLVSVAENEIFGVKYYPAGATTNSEHGGTSLQSFLPTLELMAEKGIPLLVHAEAVDESLDIFDREAAFLERELAPICERLPELPVTVEHVSTRAGIELVRHFPNTWGTITPHHLSCDRSDLLANGLRPHLYCKPVINSRVDRDWLRSAATSGDSRFFLGSDSAPHPLAAKENAVAKAGIFNAPYALEVVAEVFYEEDRLVNLEAFVSLNGAAHYGLKPNPQRIRLVRRVDLPGEKPVSTVATADGSILTLFGVAEAGRWVVSTDLDES